MPDQFTISEVDWNDTYAQLIEVREKVFVYEQRVDREIELDGKDHLCHHVLVKDPHGHPIGTGRMSDKGKIGRVAVLIPFRGKGLGSLILNKLIEIANRENILDVRLNAQIQALPFYERHAFTPKGPVFMEAGIPHRNMHLDRSHKY